MTDGVTAQITVCGKLVTGPVGGVFDRTTLSLRCGLCAHVLGKPSADSEEELLCL
jgi:ribosomal protein S27E